jgi:hypothetical protein
MNPKRRSIDRCLERRKRSLPQEQFISQTILENPSVPTEHPSLVD